MEDDLSTKNLVTRTTHDPWNTVVGRRPRSYQIKEVGNTLIESIDHALFERDLEKAIMIGVVFEQCLRYAHSTGTR